MTDDKPLKVGKHHLEVETYSYSWPETNYIGFAFDQDLFEASYMCGSCQPSSDSRSFTVNGQAY